MATVGGAGAVNCTKGMDMPTLYGCSDLTVDHSQCLKKLLLKANLALEGCDLSRDQCVVLL